MSTPQPPHDDNATKIYLWPNLFTAGNLLCGFMAILKILQGTIERANGMMSETGWIQIYLSSLYFILAACIFDLLDGRVARTTKSESPFGREFDSIADIVSFGVAPALLVYEIVLKDIGLGWLIAGFYLVCGALRLARFNVFAAVAHKDKGPGNEFTGFPIPAGAGLVSSITLLILHFYGTDVALDRGWGKYFLVAILIFVSLMMFSGFKYPSFKSFSFRTAHSPLKFGIAVVVLALTIKYYEWMLAVVFVSYLLYGFCRPFVSRATRRQIEDDDDDDEDEASQA
ncbi:CDP-diacylglycerol---serine O-phosphatidyltransferase [Verrucomicrobium sp. GAS474]|uniref:CDP-diacylglycerol--serine O-phosphatidyltransferase n=1 Tax=Verrucomicrobium sp. GAS474 TaxID=1882831 RepID=UPI00087B2FA3|nr:CDP-diacylglycerol--serine O-phosphatidyltransferase [Verrucomicrobium sp. GAS474]SDU07430.1 CDP-diacylglycerol---serine O-phosphatidyltransferase [Verrucomicrobium sp. GAS474]